MEMKRPLEIELVIPVRTYDIDYGGVVSNIVYIRWLEDMRTQMICEHISQAKQLEDGFAAVAASTHIEYKRPLRLLDQPIGRMWLADLGRVRWKVQAEIELNGQVVTKAEQTGAFVSLATLRPITPPLEFSLLWQKHLERENLIGAREGV
jgi:acyl-CoA thioester hydrolase